MPEAGGAHFSRQGPAELAYRELKDKSPEQGENGLGHSHRWFRRPDIENTDKNQDEAHTTQSCHVDGTATEVWHKAEPVNETANKGKAGPAEGQRISSASTEANLREEVRAIVREAHAAKDLTSKDETSNFGTAKLEALEAIPVAGSDSKLLFEVVGINDSSERLAWIDVGGRCRLEAAQRFLRFFDAAHSDKVPWRLWSHVNKWNKEKWPDPLDSEWDLVTPLISASRKAL